MPPSFPTMSSCFRGSSQAYAFEIDIPKPASSSSFSSSLSGLSSQTSSPSSTLSESSNSPPRTISFKRARAPRKRPNQTYNEAAALLSTINPAIFPTDDLKSPSTTKPNTFYSFDESPELLPPFPVHEDAALLIHKPSSEKPTFLFELKTASPLENSCTSPTSNEFCEPSSPSPLDDDFDTQSMLDEEIGEGIDSIMGNQTESTTATSANTGAREEAANTYTSHISPYIRGLIGLQSSSKFELGLAFRFRRNIHHTAIRQRDDSDWWRYQAVPVNEIQPKLKQSAATALSSEKKKKKKVAANREELAARDKQNNASTTATTTAVSLQEKLKATGLGLKLSHEEVINAWSGQGSVFSDGSDSPNSSPEARAKLADIELCVDGSASGGVREASVMRYKEKRMARLFSKKIRYQVRKVNADSRPRMKGRFVRRPALLQQTIEEES